MENNLKDHKGGWYNATWARILIAVILGKFIQAKLFPEVGAVIIIPLTMVVAYLIWELIVFIIGKSANEIDPNAPKQVPMWKKSATIVVAIFAFVFVFFIASALSRSIFDGTDTANVHLPSESNEEFLRKEVDAMNGSLPMMIDEETRLDTTYASPNEKINYKYTLINYEANEIDFSNLRDELEQNTVNGYCTHPDIEGYRSRNIAMVYHYFGKDGIFIGSLEANNQGCI